MHRIRGVALVLTAISLLAAGVARAITYGTPDGTGHPYVGLVALYSGGVYQGRCSGALISRTVVLTAAHCIADTGATSARVFFDPSVTFGLTTTTGGATGIPHADEHFSFASLPSTSHVAVIVLAHRVNGITPAVLADPGALNGRKARP